MKGQGKPKARRKVTANEVIALAKELEKNYDPSGMGHKEGTNLGGSYADVIREPRTKMQRIKRKRSKVAKRARRTQRRSS